MAAIKLVCILALLAAPAAAIEGGANPLEKVIELLDTLYKQINADGEADADAHEAHTDLYEKDRDRTEKVIKENEEKIARLESDLKEAEAFREGKNKDFVDLSNDIAKDEAELKAGRDARKKERAVFETNEATFVESIDQLDRALDVMAKKQPAAAASAAASAASLISVAEKLKNTLTKGSDVSLTNSQRETLNTFVRTAYIMGDFGKSVEQEAPSFLQRRLHLKGPYGDFESSSDGLVTTLEDLLHKVETERDSALEDEKEDKDHFQEWEAGLVEFLKNGKKSLADIKSSIAQSQQESSMKEASLMESKEIYKTEVEHMEELENEYRRETNAYKMRLRQRTDEGIAVSEAQRLLSNDLAKGYIKKQSIGIVGNKASSLMQVTLEKTAAWRKAISLLAVKSAASADPFRKVKSMIKGMLNKLMETQAQESKHAAWCDSEMGKTAQQMKKKVDDVQKTKDRLEALQANLEETTTDLEEVTKNLKELVASMGEAQSLREKESKKAHAAIKEYGDAAGLMKRAITVLKNYYQRKSDPHTENVGGNAAKQRKGLGSGIIGILEIAADDFSKLHSESKLAEELAAQDFKELHSQGNIRRAVFEKDVEWKTRTKVKLEYDESQMKNDLESYEKELTAINAYMSKLEASCTVQGPSYEERKSKREEELASLKEALATLKARGS